MLGFLEMRTDHDSPSISWLTFIRKFPHSTQLARFFCLSSGGFTTFVWEGVCRPIIARTGSHHSSHSMVNHACSLPSPTLVHLGRIPSAPARRHQHHLIERMLSLPLPHSCTHRPHPTSSGAEQEEGEHCKAVSHQLALARSPTRNKTAGRRLADSNPIHHPQDQCTATHRQTHSFQISPFHAPTLHGISHFLETGVSPRHGTRRRGTGQCTQCPR
mmetsp:Transcript_20441/g.46819  ORF Transcript_20441/g.46819 Transcript_20441/m.46819 type:complete len:216 (-) Transcript_20441:119-766(-)